MKLTVCVQTYNHEKYIAQCLDGILNQVTDFDFEILIGEDDSSDLTREICIQYAKEKPNKIHLSLNSRSDVIYINGAATGRFNIVNNLRKAKGEYIALCDGDDYWTDKNKLQNQIDLLDQSPHINICFHRALLVHEDKQSEIHPVPEFVLNQSFEYSHLLEHENFITTASVVIRNNKQLQLPKWFFTVPFGDLALYKIFSAGRKIYCIDKVMSIYNLHNDGAWSGLNTKRMIGKYLDFYRKIYQHYDTNEQEVVRKKYKNKLRTLLAVSKIEFLRNALLYLTMTLNKSLLISKTESI